MFDDYRKEINAQLEQYIENMAREPEALYRAVKYSVEAGGKRIRPILSMLACDMLGGDTYNACAAGCAIELIHTFSLIHDDLPCMDDDDLRRGQPTCHRAFGEATALLAGDALLALAFEVLSDISNYRGMDSGRMMDIINVISRAAGHAGMTGGQVLDMEYELAPGVSERQLADMYYRKTGALICAAGVSGAVAAGASKDDREKIYRFSKKIGLAFQIKDEILDCEGDEALLGKSVGSDVRNAKTTFVTLLGMEGAKNRLSEVTASAVSELDAFGGQGKGLKEFAGHLIDREF